LQDWVSNKTIFCCDSARQEGVKLGLSSQHQVPMPLEPIQGEAAPKRTEWL